MRFRTAGVDDITGLREMLHLAFRAYVAGIGREWTGGPKWLEERITQGRVLVNEVPDHGLAGFLAYSFEPDAPCMTIDMLAVHPELQRQGLGRALLAEGESIARHTGVEVLRLHTVAKYTALVRFYERQGFTVARLGPSEDRGDEHLRAYLEKQLD